MSKSKVFALTIATGIIFQTTYMAPVFAAVTSGSKSSSKASLSDAQIMATYHLALQNANGNVEEAIAEATGELVLVAGVSEKRLKGVFERELQKDPEAYAAVVEKLAGVQVNDLAAVREATAAGMEASQKTGLSWKSQSCNDTTKLGIGIALGVVALVGGIVAISLSKSDKKIKKNFDNDKQARKNQYLDTQYYITNAPQILTQQNGTLVQNIANLQGDISQYQQSINEAEIEINQVNTTFQVAAENGITLSPEKIQELKDKKTAAENKKSNASSAIQSAYTRISEIGIEIAKNEQKIDYYSNPANVNYELDAAEVVYNSDLLNIEQDYQNALALAPGKRKAAPWVGVGAAVSAGVGTTLILTRNKGC